jgi:hypothetical protein
MKTTRVQFHILMQQLSIKSLLLMDCFLATENVKYFHILQHNDLYVSVCVCELRALIIKANILIIRDKTRL